MNNPLSSSLFHRRLFLAQCINHLGAIFLTLFWIGTAWAIGVEQNIINSEIQEIGISAGISILFLLYFSGVLFRSLSILFFGSTLGFALMKLEPQKGSFSKSSWAGVFFEASHLPLVGVWIFEWILRFKGHKLWNDLSIEKSSISL